ncbi:ATP-binding protein [Streptomyces sp. FXJ7.023]|uniref:ATP-binding protein n=1 Tax=Streptomyces sp. FXJ7.023 TaxID=579932 RepID=UPI001F3EC17D|nr:ATP-binding protein [Streptomyces sp. FXJ7.023]
MTGETTVSTAARIHGRSAQRRVLRALLDQLPTRGGPLLVTGEPGLGRTALLTWAAGSFRTGPVFRPAPGREPDGAGPTAGELLAVLRAAARQAPALVCVDDAHLLDTAARAALGHAAKCLPAADRVGLLVSVAGHRAVDPDFAHLPTLRLDPLTPPQAAALLDDATDGAAAPAVRERLVAEAEGNPALLLALVRRLSPAELRGRLPLPAPLADAATLAAVAGGGHTRRRPRTGRTSTRASSWTPYGGCGRRTRWRSAQNRRPIRPIRPSRPRCPALGKPCPSNSPKEATGCASTARWSAVRCTPPPHRNGAVPSTERWPRRWRTPVGGCPVCCTARGP